MRSVGWGRAAAVAVAVAISGCTGTWGAAIRVGPKPRTPDVPARAAPDRAKEARVAAAVRDLVARERLDCRAPATPEERILWCESGAKARPEYVTVSVRRVADALRVEVVESHAIPPFGPNVLCPLRDRLVVGLRDRLGRDDTRAERSGACDPAAAP
jgi:hypothetical protein